MIYNRKLYPKFLKYKGFDVCDEADNGIQLWYLPFGDNSVLPKFMECAKKNNISFKAVKISSREEARSAPTPITTYALFCDGEYVTNEQMNEKKFLKMIGV